MKKKDRNGDYYLEYILENPPAKADKIIWKEAVKEQLRRMGVSDEEFHKVKTVKNMPWRDLRRLYNRLVGEGKQRKDKFSKSGADGPFMHSSYKDAKKVLGRFKKKHEEYNPGDEKLTEAKGMPDKVDKSKEYSVWVYVKYDSIPEKFDDHVALRDAAEKVLKKEKIQLDGGGASREWTDFSFTVKGGDLFSAINVAKKFLKDVGIKKNDFKVEVMAADLDEARNIMKENVNEYMKQFQAPGVDLDDGLPVLIPNPKKPVLAAPNHGGVQKNPSLNHDKKVDGRVMDNAFNQDASINRRMGFVTAAAGQTLDKLTLREIELAAEKVDLGVERSLGVP